MTGKGLRALAGALALGVLLLAACTPEEGFDVGGTPQPSNPEYVRTPPPLRLAEYVGDNVLTGSGTVQAGAATARIDLTNVDQGYVAVQCEAPGDVQFIMIKGSDDKNSEGAMQLPMDNDGSTNIFNFSQGSGDYYLIVYVHNLTDAEGPKYTRILESWVTVNLADEFAPFLINTREMDYDADSTAVQFSYDLARHAATDLEVAQQVYSWIQDNVDYDNAKAEQVRVASGYIPDPDETLATKTGICYDYAALAATMLRANGIPCKMVKGDALVDPETGRWVYHAWNLVWIDEAGWIAVQMPTAPGDYFRIDLTFAAGAGGGRTVAEHVQTDANYSTIYIT